MSGISGILDSFTNAAAMTNNLGLGIVSAIQRKKERQQALDLTRETNSQNLGIMQEQWNREDNAYQRAVKDARAAGLSAFSVAGTGGAGAGDIVSMQNPADAVNSAGSYAGALADLRTNTQSFLDIEGAKAEIDKVKAETNNTENAEKRAQELHLLTLKGLGIDVRNKQRYYDTEDSLKQAQKHLVEAETDTTLKKDEREAKKDFYETQIKALESERDKLQLDLDKATTYNPEFMPQRIANERTKLATDNSNMVYENTVNRYKSQQAQIETYKARSMSDYEIAKAATQAAQEEQTLIKLKAEAKTWSKKQKAELVNEWTEAVKNGANGLYLVSEGVRKWVSMATGTELVNSIGFKPYDF